MSKSGANVLLIFQCPVICPTPSQVDIIVSNDPSAFIAQLCITEILLGPGRDQSQIRIKSEVGTYL